MNPLPGIFISEFFQQAGQFVIGQFPSVRSPQQFLGLGYGGVPLVHSDLPSDLPLLQLVISPVVLYLGRRLVSLSLGLFAVGPHLSAGALGLSGGGVVAVTDQQRPGVSAYLASALQPDQTTRYYTLYAKAGKPA